MNTDFRETLKPLFFMGVGALLTVVINKYTTLDVEITNLFFDVKTQVFPLKDVAWLTAVFHDGLKYLSSALWLVLFLKMLFLIFSEKAFSGADLTRKKTVVFNYCYVLVASLLAAALTTYLKLKSSYACPWGLSIYGSTAPHLRLFEHVPAALSQGFVPGKCFPSGHASVGFMWLALLMLKEPVGFFKKPVLIGFITTVCLLSGGVQIMRGAHFLSHVMATGVLCWFVVWFTHEAMVRLGKPFLK